MHVLLLKNKTTPIDSYEETLRSADHEPQFIPLLTHTHLDKLEITQFLRSEFLVADAFIITSQRAVECFNECMKMIGDCEESRIIFSKPGYTVGPATAEILMKAGFKDVRGGIKAGNGSILADIITEEVETDKKLVFFTGEIRKDIIPKKLKSKGFELKEKILYKTEPRNDIVDNFNSHKLRLKGKSAWLVFFSPQGTETIVEYLQENSDHGFNIASIGPTTEEYLKEKGIHPVAVASKPNASSLYDIICTRTTK